MEIGRPRPKETGDDDRALDSDIQDVRTPLQELDEAQSVPEMPIEDVKDRKTAKRVPVDLENRAHGLFEPLEDCATTVVVEAVHALGAPHHARSVDRKQTPPDGIGDTREDRQRKCRTE